MQIGFFTLPTSQSLAALEAQAEFKGNIKTSNGHKKRKKKSPRRWDAKTLLHGGLLRGVSHQQRSTVEWHVMPCYLVKIHLVPDERWWISKTLHEMTSRETAISTANGHGNLKSRIPPLLLTALTMYTTMSINISLRYIVFLQYNFFPWHRCSSLTEHLLVNSGRVEVSPAS